MHQLNNPLPSVALVTSLLLLPALPAMASQSTSQQVSPGVTMGQLEQLHTRNLILQAQVQGAQLERQLEENQTGNSAATAAPVPAPVNAVGYSSLPAVTPRAAAASHRPVVLEINGRDKNLRATLQLSSGQTLVVGPGNRLPGTEQTVRSISLAGVTLSDGTLLAFGE